MASYRLPLAIWLSLSVLCAYAEAALEPTPLSRTICDAQQNVGALFDIDTAGHQTLVCSGVLIEDDVVLTAAHCLPANKEAPWLSFPMRYSFVVGDKPFPTRGAQEFTVRAILTWPDYQASRLSPSPLFAREAHDDSEEEWLKQLEKRCGKRDGLRFGNREWIQCLLAQSPELQRAVGLDDGEAHDNDIALLFLQANYASNESQTPLFPTACSVRKSKASDAEEIPLAPHTKERLRLVGFGYDADRQDISVWSKLYQFFFRPVVRRKEELRVAKTSKFEIVLADNTRTCTHDSGAALFRRPQPTRPAQLVGIFSRPEAQSRPGFDVSGCNKGGVATNLAAYWPWIDASMRDACRNGKRHPSMCPQWLDDNTTRPTRKEGRVIDRVETDE